MYSLGWVMDWSDERKERKERWWGRGNETDSAMNYARFQISMIMLSVSH
jgi:hypothetical protein